MNGKAVKIFQKYTGEQRAAHAASHRLFHQQRAAIGETFWTHPDVPNIAFKTRKDANAAALRQAGRGEGVNMYDVLAVNIKTSKVRFMAQGKTEKNAEAIINMAIMRRGVDEEFYTEVEAGKYKEGDTYEGKD